MPRPPTKVKDCGVAGCAGKKFCMNLCRYHYRNLPEVRARENASEKIYRANNKEKIRARHAKWKSRHPEYNRKQSFFKRYKRAMKSAKDRGLDWGITRAQYAILSLMVCHYCSQPIGSGVGLDRIDNSVGYLPTNVLPCCFRCNSVRGDQLTVQEMEIAMKAILQVI